MRLQLSVLQALARAHSVDLEPIQSRTACLGLFNYTLPCRMAFVVQTPRFDRDGRHRLCVHESEIRNHMHVAPPAAGAASSELTRVCPAPACAMFTYQCLVHRIGSASTLQSMKPCNGNLARGRGISGVETELCVHAVVVILCQEMPVATAAV